MVESLPRLVAFAALAAFVVFCLGLTFSRGLCCADDGFLAVTARNIATGAGYVKPLDDSALAPPGLRFDPPIGVGPTLVVPAAVLLKVIGVHEAVPGATAILVWACALALLLARAARRTTGPAFLLGVVVMLFAVLSVFPFHFEQWYAFLGEIPAAALALLAFWIVAMERPTRGLFLLAGVLLGLAVEAKLLALLAVPGFLVVLAVRSRRAAREGQTSPTPYAALALLGCLLPAVAFEAVKLQQLGLQRYLMEAKRLSWIVREQGLLIGHGPLLGLVQERLHVMQDRFAIHAVAVLGFAVFTLALSVTVLEKRWRLLFLGLSLSTWCLGGYWLFFSIGWPRYLVIALAMACFVLAVPVFAARRAWQRGLLALLAVTFVAGGITRLPFVLYAADNGLFRPSTDRLARDRLVSVISGLEERGPAALCSTGWASFVDVEFSLRGRERFRRCDQVVDLPGEKIILLNRRFSDFSDPLVKDILSRASATLFDSGPYLLLRFH